MASVPVELTHAPFTLAEATRAGLTARQLQGSSWRRLAHGVYAWRGLPDTPLVTLAAISRRLPPGAAFSGRTAGWLLGLDLPPCDPIEVTVPPHVGVSSRAGVQIRRADLTRADLCLRQGLILTKPVRTVTDLARTRDLVESVVALDMALHQRLVGLPALNQFLEQHPSGRGTALLRRALALAEPATESPMETRLRLLLVQARLPRPMVQASLHDAGGRFLGRADLYYPAHRLVLEYDGDTHRDSLIRDNRRQNALIVAGYNVLRFTAPDLYTRPLSVVGMVREELTRCYVSPYCRPES